MLDESRIAELAQKLQKAEDEKQFIRMFSIEHPEMTIEDAYAIQRAWTAIKLAKGRVVKGHKIGLTSRAMQSAVGIDEPDYGVLFDDMFWNDGAVIPFEKYLSARIEVELAFVLTKPLAGPHCMVFDVLDATSYVTPALEILESRMHRLDPQTKALRKVTDTISDNAANAAIVTGGRPFRPQDIDLRWVSALLFRNGQIEETGVAAGVLNNPAQGVAWLTNRLAPHGEQLQAGEIVLSGSFTRPVDVRRGDTFHADYGPYGSVSCHFA
jgi:2-oxo-hept-3-ene-1,7-dioate hydratase